MTTLLSLLFCLACSDPDDLVAGLPVGDECPMLDCRDQLTLVVLGPDGAPQTRFLGWVRTGDGLEVTFDCADGAGDGCAADGRVSLFLYASQLEASISEGPDGASYSGTIAPAWEAPYDSDACGHVCYLAEETVTLEACEGCG